MMKYIYRWGQSFYTEPASPESSVRSGFESITDSDNHNSSSKTITEEEKGAWITAQLKSSFSMYVHCLHCIICDGMCSLFWFWGLTPSKLKPLLIVSGNIVNRLFSTLILILRLDFIKHDSFHPFVVVYVMTTLHNCLTTCFIFLILRACVSTWHLFLAENHWQGAGNCHWRLSERFRGFQLKKHSDTRIHSLLFREQLKRDAGALKKMLYEHAA